MPGFGSNSYGFGHGPFGNTVKFGNGPWPTFTQTPSYVFAEDISYAVEVLRFEDLSEHRFLTSRERGLVLSLDYARTDSATQQAVQSWFVAMGGQAARFIATDFRTGSQYVVRFADGGITYTHGPGLIRTGPQVQLKVLRTYP